MDNNKPDRVRLFRFYTWLAKPPGIYSLNTTLAQLRDVELLHLMQDHTNMQAVTIAWAEYGRRHQLANIMFTMEQKDVLKVQATNLVLAAGVGIA